MPNKLQEIRGGRPGNVYFRVVRNEHIPMIRKVIRGAIFLGTASVVAGLAAHLIFGAQTGEVRFPNLKPQPAPQLPK